MEREEDIVEEWQRLERGSDKGFKVLEEKKHGSIMKIGNMNIHVVKKFNIVQKRFWRIFFGVEIKDL